MLTLLDFKGALNSFNKAIKLDNNNDLAYNFKGISLFNLNDYPGAFQSFNKAIELKPNDGLYYYNRGLYFYKIGNFHESFRNLQDAKFFNAFIVNIDDYTNLSSFLTYK